MDKIQTVAIIAGAIFLIWFAAPLAAGGNLNLGNFTGMAFSLLLILYGIFKIRIHKGIVSLWDQKGGRVFLILLLAAAAVILIIAAVETVWMVKAARNSPPKNTTAVLLGCSVKGTRPSTILKERMDAAYEYLKENPGAVCILSGGQGAGEDISEAECMFRYLTEKGISGERLILEDTSTTTEENLVNTKAVLQELGLGMEITIITSEFHEYRANAMAEKLGFLSYSTPSRTFIGFLPTFYVRELYGILYYMIT